MGYTKLFSSITESSLWSEPKEVRILFVSMLARADATGFVEASLPGLARMSNLTLEETESGIANLEGPDKYSKNEDNEGRRITKVDGGWCIINYEEYRNRRSDEDRREYMREYMAKYRRGKHSVNSTANKVSKKANSKPSVSRGKPPLAQATATASSTAPIPNAQPTNPRARGIPKNWEEVKAEAEMRAIPIAEAERFFHHFESSGWIDKNGHQIKCWRSKLRTWATDNRSIGAEKAHHASNGKPKPEPRQIQETIVVRQL
ncbi:MAG: hypothetical protein O2931_08400 [Planctomycetota bacterium]|nr:hypothetical protein [Planctomycetota bacterium]